MTEYQYILCPIIAWFVTGLLKLIVNILRSGFSIAINQIGYGGFPSNHAAIITSTLFLILLNKSYDSPSFGIIFTVAIIILIDAKSLRGQITKHAMQINKLNENKFKKNYKLRERIGHTFIDIIGGCFVGFFVAFLIFLIK